MNSSAILRWIALLLAGLLAIWFFSATEWAEVEVNTPPKGEARRNTFFATGLLAQELGARFENRKTLDAMPPPGAVLLLESRYWDLFPGRAERLRQWVQDGGHLVLPAASTMEKGMSEWLPVETVKREERSTQRSRPGGRREDQCRPVADAARPDDPAYRLCAWPYWRDLRSRAGVTASWKLQGPQQGVELLRAPFGRGSVTVYGPVNLLHNQEVVRTGSDHAAIVAAALQFQKGTVVWLVPDEARPPLLAWTWQQGWIAVLLALAAAAAWVWRRMVRFGPRGAVPPLDRRSMREQVTGTASFLRRHAPAALHQAQVRALLEAARTRLPGPATRHAKQAVEPIAKATGLPAADLRGALSRERVDGAILATDLELLEQARRRLARPASPTRTEP